MTFVTGGLVYPVRPHDPFVRNEPAGTAHTVDWSRADVQLLDVTTASGNVDVSFTNPRDGATYQLVVVRDGAGNDVATWPANIRWPNSTAPTLQSSGNGDVYDLVQFVYDGTLDIYHGRDLSGPEDAGYLTGTLDPARIGDGSLALIKLANLAANTVVGRITGTGAPEAIAVTAAGRALLDDADASTQRTTLGLAAIASSGSAADLSSGTLPIARIADGDVTLAKLANLAADRVIGRTTGTGVPEAIAVTAAGRALLDDADASTQRTTLGLAAIASSGSASDLSTGSIPAARIANATLTNAMHAKIAAHTVLGNNGATAAAPAELTQAQLTGEIDTRTDSLSGAMPARMGRWASRSTTGSIADTLTQVVGSTLAANLLAVGSVIRFRATGLLTNTTTASSSVLTLRINASSLGSTIVGSWTVALGTTGRTNVPFVVEGELVVLATGAVGTGSAWGTVAVLVNTSTALATPTSMITSAVTIDTTSSRVIELACKSGAASTTWNFITATIEFVQP